MTFLSALRSLLPSSKKSTGEVTAQWTVIGSDVGGVNDRNLLQSNKEWVFIAADKIARSVAGIRFKVMRYQRNGDDQEVFDGPLVDFLESPAKDYTGKDFLYLTTSYKELTGNAFWEIEKDRKLRPLIPTSIAPVVENGKLTGYRYSEGGKQRVIAPENVLHDRYVDPAKPYWGVGKLAKIARWVDTSGFANEFLRRFFVNGATFGGFIETEEETEERIKLIKAGLANDHVGVDNAHKTGVLPKGAKYQRVTGNMSEIEMGETDDRYRDKILAGFGVPKTLVGLTTDVNRASAEASEYIFAKYTIKPIADSLIEFLNMRVAPLLDTTGKFYFAYEEFVPINEELKLKEREIALNKQPYMTQNEVRASAGLPPVKGGDVIYGNPMLAPLGQPQAAPESNPGEDEEDEPKKAAPARIRGALRRERLIEDIVEKTAKAIPDLSTFIDPDIASHKAFVGRVSAHENLIAGRVRDFNNQQERDVQQNLRSITKAVSKTDLFNMDEEVRVMVDAISPLLSGLMIEQAVEEYLAQGFTGTLDPNAEAIQRIVHLAAKRLARSYNNTTAKLLKQALNDGITNGDDLSQLAARVKQVYDYSNEIRALMVARTEAFYIANEANREAYRQSGVVKTMRWYTAEDELVCEYCGPMHGTVIGINESFFKKGEEMQGRDGGVLKLDYRAINVPPLHTNCRCFIRPETIEVS